MDARHNETKSDGANRTTKTRCGVSPEPTSIPNADPLYDATAAAEYLGLVGVVKHPEQAVRALCRKHHLRSTRVCGKVMTRRSWLEAYIATNAREDAA